MWLCMLLESAWPHLSNKETSGKCILEGVQNRRTSWIFIRRNLVGVVNHLQMSSYHCSSGGYHSRAARDTKHKQFKNNREQIRTMICITSCNPDLSKPQVQRGTSKKGFLDVTVKTSSFFL